MDDRLIKKLNNRGSAFLGDSENFLSLEDLAKKFVKENKLPKILRKQLTTNGLILDFGEYGLAILNSENKGSMFPQRYIGGDGSYVYSSKKMVYTLDGKLNNRKIDLMAEVVIEEDYKVEKSVPRELYPRFSPTGEKREFISRKDKEPYWFLKSQENNLR